MIEQARPRHGLEPEHRRIRRLRRPDVVEHRFGRADVDGDGLAAVQPAGQQQVARLLPEEGHRERSVRRNPENPAGIAMDPARHVDGDDGRSPLVHCVHHRAGDAVERPGKPGAEERIDDQPAVVQQRGRHRLDRTVPSVGHHRRVALEHGALGQQSEADRPAGAAQQARDDEPVAAVVAGSAQNDDRLRLPPGLDCVRDAMTGRFHQRLAGDAGRDRRGVGRVHLLDREQRQRTWNGWGLIGHDSLSPLTWLSALCPRTGAKDWHGDADARNRPYPIATCGVPPRDGALQDGRNDRMDRVGFWRCPDRPRQRREHGALDEIPRTQALCPDRYAGRARRLRGPQHAATTVDVAALGGPRLRLRREGCRPGPRRGHLRRTGSVGVRRRRGA